MVVVSSWVALSANGTAFWVALSADGTAFWVALSADGTAGSGQAGSPRLWPGLRHSQQTMLDWQLEAVCRGSGIGGPLSVFIVIQRCLAWSSLELGWKGVGRNLE